MAGQALEASLQKEMIPNPLVQSPAAIKAANFRRLRNELRAKRREKEEVKQKLLRLQDLQRQHLLTKANIDKHEPKVASRAAREYLNAALTKIGLDIADSTKQVGVIDGAIKGLAVDHAKYGARVVEIGRLDSALVVKIKEDQAARATLADLLKKESELKAGIDDHRIVSVGELRSKVANGRALKGSLEAQLENTLEKKTYLVNKLANVPSQDMTSGTKSIVTEEERKVISKV